MFEIEAGPRYLAGGGIPETCRHGDGWAIVGVGLNVAGTRARVHGDAEWAIALPADGHFVAVRHDADGLALHADPLGLRALYFVRDGDTLVFSTRLDWIAALTGRRRLDAAAFGAHWLLFNQLGHGALLAGVERLGPGQTLRVDKAGTRLSPTAAWMPRDQPVNPIAFEQALQPLVFPDDPGGLSLSLGLSGGMDSRLLLALRSADAPIRLHTFGDAHDPDAAMARRLARAVDLPIATIDAPLPDAETCLALLRGHMALTQAVSPASGVLGLRHFAALREKGSWLIDGGFGEVARQQYLNRLRLRGRKVFARRDAAGVMPFLRLHRVDVFSAEARRQYEAGAMQELDAALAALPTSLNVDDALDLLSIRARLPNFFGYEQNRLDGEILNFMPFAQPSVLHALFATPTARRRHGRLFRELIRAHQPALTRFPLVKGLQTYPFAFPPLPAYLWTEAARRVRPARITPMQGRFLWLMESVARDRVRDQSVREDGRYDHARLLELVDGYYERRHSRVTELDWWLALDAWWSSLDGPS
ncbi:MAG: hypothetical protein R2834_07505 [Rhodothermales bacterium]